VCVDVSTFDAADFLQMTTLSNSGWRNTHKLAMFWIMLLRFSLEWKLFSRMFTFALLYKIAILVLFSN